MTTPASTTPLTDERRRELLAAREQVAQRTFKLPNASSFDDLFDLFAVWDHSRFNHVRGERSDEYPEGAKITVKNWQRAGSHEIEVGPFCSVERQTLKQRYALAVRPKQVVLDAIQPFIMGDANESWSFKIIDHGEVALVVGEPSLILGSVWLAYIDPATIPGDEGTA